MQKMFAALAAQPETDRLEIIIVDAASDEAPALSLPPEFQVRVLRAEAGTMPGRARFEGTRNATAPYVAFLEDHCYPEPDWSDAVIRAHRAGWAAVGYAFRNGSPESYLYRAIFLTEYGMWSLPHAGGPTTRLPGCNVSYRKAELLRFGSRLGELLEMDYLLHESLRERGLKFYIESKARVAHESYASFLELLYCHFLFSRLQAARRARIFSWGVKRRLILGLAAPFVLPMLQLFRAGKTLGATKHRSAWLISIPIVFLIHQCESLGECLGFLAGSGASDRIFALRELNGARIGR